MTALLDPPSLDTPTAPTKPLGPPTITIKHTMVWADPCSAFIEHDYHSRSEPHLSTEQFAQLVLDYLDRNGWVKGVAYIPKRGYCLSAAITNVGRDGSIASQIAFRRAVQAQIGSDDIPSWNDMRRRRWRHVKKLLKGLGATC